MSLALTYPGGQLKTITIAATAGNVVTDKTPGPRKRWVLLYGRVTLVLDATVADRYLDLQITDGTNILDGGLRNNVAFTASQTRFVSFANYQGAGLNQNINDHARFQFGGILEGADQLRVKVASGVAGDSYSGFIRVLELGL